MNRGWWRWLAQCLLAVELSFTLAGQTAPAERTFSQPASQVQAALKKLRGATSGPLPTLEGFVTAGKAPLDQYSRAFYHYGVRIVPAPNGSRVSVTARITAWHEDAAHSGYEILSSNGRLESDLLDRLQDSLEKNSTHAGVASPATSVNAAAQPTISAPLPQLPKAATPAPDRANPAPDSALQQEAKNLEDILRNQSHPANLVAVKGDNTPILQSASVDAKVLFLASAEDEFEILDLNPEWVHVRISGLSRGWLRRSMIQILGDADAADSIEPGRAWPANNSAPPVLSPSPTFSVTGEELGSFPGDWQALRGKNVKMMTVQQAPGTGRITSPQEKLAFAKSLFQNLDISALGSAAGVVVVFDSEDGGMVAATRSSLESWRNGGLREPEFWKQCFLDPPEILGNR